jgi:hypothetical protein
MLVAVLLVSKVLHAADTVTPSATEPAMQPDPLLPAGLSEVVRLVASSNWMFERPLSPRWRADSDAQQPLLLSFIAGRESG